MDESIECNFIENGCMARNSMVIVQGKLYSTASGSGGTFNGEEKEGKLSSAF